MTAMLGPLTPLVALALDFQLRLAQRQLQAISTAALP